MVTFRHHRFQFGGSFARKVVKARVQVDPDRDEYAVELFLNDFHLGTARYYPQARSPKKPYQMSLQRL